MPTNYPALNARREEERRAAVARRAFDADPEGTVVSVSVEDETTTGDQASAPSVR